MISKFHCCYYYLLKHHFPLLGNPYALNTESYKDPSEAEVDTERLSPIRKIEISPPRLVIIPSNVDLFSL